MNIQQFDVSKLARGAKQHLKLDLTTLGDGHMLSLDMLAAAGSQPGPLVVVLAGIHGDEYEGMIAIPQVYAGLDPQALRGTVVCVPVCNAPAFGSATRSSPIDGLNMARVFPGDPSGTITQRIAYWLGETIMRHADLVIDLHSAGVAYNLPMLVGYYRPAGQALGVRTRKLAEAFGAPVIWAHPDMAPGRTMSFAAEHGIPGLYTEAPGAGRARPEDVATITTGVVNCLKSLGMLDGEPVLQPVTHRLYGSGDLDHIILANTGGLFFAHVGLLDTVRKGDLLGEVRTPAGEMLEMVRSSAGGVVITLRGLLRVNAGDGLFALAVSDAE
ncbi:MAG: succinylglutamate desuccinylase/aspartoacylase family protein [Chloroflexi bacterium]|nr:succinylglutamate desuccinylase/aspartoacylase family protein [Chloroflexota bacterium]